MPTSAAVACRRWFVPALRWLLSLAVVQGAVLAAAAETYSIAIKPGSNLIANHLKRGNNSIQAVLPVVPPGTVVSRFNNAIGAYDPPETNNPATGLWFPGNTILAPGEMALLTATTAFTLTFTGAVQQATLPRDLLPARLYGYSMQTPQGGTFEAITGRLPGEGSQLWKWNNQRDAVDVYAFSAGAWSPAAPVVAVGEGVFIIGPAAGQPCVAIACPGDLLVASPDGLPQPVAYTVTISNFCGTGPVNLVTAPPAPGPFPLGTNLVTCTASVGGGNTAQCTFRIVVVRALPRLSITLQPGKVVVNWPGSYVLQAAAELGLPFVDLPGPVRTGPYTNPLTAGPMYYRLR